MKKFVSLLLVFVMISLMSIPVYAAETNAVEVAGGEKGAVYYGINEIKPEDIVRIGTGAVPQNRNGGIPFDFAGAIPNSVYSNFVEVYYSAGSTAVLEIDVCTWSPEYNNLEVGIYNWTTAENWYTTWPDGQIENEWIYFYNLSAGRYSVYIRNVGSSSLQTGYLLYKLT